MQRHLQWHDTLLRGGDRRHLIQDLSSRLQQALKNFMAAVDTNGMQQLTLCTLQWLSQPRKKLKDFLQQYETAHYSRDTAGCVFAWLGVGTRQCQAATYPAH